MYKKVPASLALGKAGEYQVASKLLLRGHDVAFPAVDAGYDLIADGCRIQVKSGRLRVDRVSSTPAYWFSLKYKKTIHGNKQTICYERLLSAECDFVTLWGANENKFWIVPSVTLDRQHSLRLGSNTQYKEIDSVEIKRLHDLGLKHEDIAIRLGTSIMTVSRRLRGMFTSPPDSLAITVRKLEDRWDLIDKLIEDRKRATESNSILVKEII